VDWSGEDMSILRVGYWIPPTNYSY
jgi:hypothetical protein